MTVNLPEKWSINLKEKNGTWQFYIHYYDQNNKRHQKWINTKFKIRGNKRAAEAMEQDVINEWVPKLFEKIGINANNDNLPSIKSSQFEKPHLLSATKLQTNQRILLVDYLKSWLVASKIRYQITTYTEYCRVFNKTVIPYFESTNLYLDEVKTSHIQGFYEHLQKMCLGIQFYVIIHICTRRYRMR